MLHVDTAPSTLKLCPYCIFALVSVDVNDELFIVGMWKVVLPCKELN